MLLQKGNNQEMNNRFEVQPAIAINEGHYYYQEQIELIRQEIDKTQNKATNAHIGKLKAKIAQLKLKEESNGSLRKWWRKGI